jgi:DNA-binding NarL/FixJ family response regulator
MPTKCILACTDELLFESIVESLLAQHDDLELIQMIGNSKMELLEAIEINQPQVLVLCHRTHDTFPTDYLFFLQHHPDLKIITVSMADNYMHIYGKQKVLIKQSTDLLSVIQNP